MFSCVSVVLCVFFFKQKTAYEMRISDWSSDVCSSDLDVVRSCLDDEADVGVGVKLDAPPAIESWCIVSDPLLVVLPVTHALADERSIAFSQALSYRLIGVHPGGSLDLQLRRQAQAMGSRVAFAVQRSDEHTSELQSLMRISYAVFC